jgi:hypothetical protein
MGWTAEQQRGLAKSIIELRNSTQARTTASIKEIAKRGGIGATTLVKYENLYDVVRCDLLPKLQQIAALVDILSVILHPGGRFYLNQAQEQHLLIWIITRSNRGRPARATEVQYMARGFKIIGMRCAAQVSTEEKDNFDYIAEDSIPLPTYQWFYDFCERHGDRLKFKALNTKTCARYDAEDPVIIRKWFDDVFLPALEKYNIKSPDQIVAMDEVGFIDNSEVHGSVKYLCAIEDDKRIEVKQSNYHYSVLHICSAAGLTWPPIAIFQGEWLKTNMLEGAPPGTKYHFQTNGYFVSDYFPDVIRHVAEHGLHAEGQETEEVTIDRLWQNERGENHSETTTYNVFDRLLICDNSSVHISEEAFEIAKQLKIHIIFLPPNSTHIMQVSDLAVFALMKRKWYHTLIDWNSKLHVDQVGLTKDNFWLRLGPAWNVATEPHRIRLGFKKAGQCPVDVDEVLRSIPAIQNETVNPEFLTPRNDTLLRQRTEWHEFLATKRTLSLTNKELRETKEQAKQSEIELKATQERVTQLEQALALIEMSRNVQTGNSISVQTTVTDNFESDDSSIVVTAIVEMPTSFDRMIEFADVNQAARLPKLAIKPKVDRCYDHYLHPQNLSDPLRLLDEQMSFEEKVRQQQLRMGLDPMTKSVVRGDPTSLQFDKATALIERLHDSREKLSAEKAGKTRKRSAAAKAKRKEALANKQDAKSKRVAKSSKAKPATKRGDSAQPKRQKSVMISTSSSSSDDNSDDDDEHSHHSSSDTSAASESDSEYEQRTTSTAQQRKKRPVNTRDDVQPAAAKRQRTVTAVRSTRRIPPPNRVIGASLDNTPTDSDDELLTSTVTASHSNHASSCSTIESSEPWNQSDARSVHVTIVITPISHRNAKRRSLQLARTLARTKTTASVSLAVKLNTQSSPVMSDSQ